MCTSTREIIFSNKGLKGFVWIVALHLYETSEIYESDLKDEESAKEILLNGIENCDDKAPLYVKLGDYHFQNDSLEEAEVLYKRALEENDEDVYSHFGLTKFIWQENNIRKQKNIYLVLRSKLKRAKISS